MFGYIQVRKPELKIKDYDVYHAFYCGLCECLKKRHGLKGQITLTYDMTFLVILLTSLYDVKCQHEKVHCILHPAKKHDILYNEVSDYCADINMILSYYHCKDDKQDDHSVKGFIGEAVYKKSGKMLSNKYKNKANVIKNELNELDILEKSGSSDIIALADCFGRMLAEIFVYREDAFKKYLMDMGYYMGRFIYIMDAYDDLEEDIKKERFNPFKNLCSEENFEDKVREMLYNEISLACAAFEQMPCIDYIDILRNILYAGVWNIYDTKNKDKNNTKTEEIK